MKNPKVTKIRKELKDCNKKKKKKNTSFKLLILLFLIVAVVCVLLFCKNSKEFVIKSVTVKGNNKYKTEELVGKLNLNNKNIFSVQIEDIEKKLKTYPYIEKVITYKKIPNEIYVTIEERKILYYALNSDSNEVVFLDKNGVMLESISKENYDYTFPLIEGIKFEKILKYGEKINEVEISKLQAIEKVNRVYMAEEIDKKITNVKFDGVKIIITLDEKFKVILEDNKELEYKMRFLNKILREVEDSPCEIDMTKNSPLYKKVT